MIWEITHEDGTQETVQTWEIVSYLKKRYPDFHIAVYQKTVEVWSCADVVGNANVNRIAVAVRLY